jgi:hypothetical protein
MRGIREVGILLFLSFFMIGIAGCGSDERVVREGGEKLVEEDEGVEEEFKEDVEVMTGGDFVIKDGKHAGKVKNYTIIIEADKSADKYTINYTNLGCGGDLTLVSSTLSTMKFTQTITYGDCQNSTIELIRFQPLSTKYKQYKDDGSFTVAMLTFIDNKTKFLDVPKRYIKKAVQTSFQVGDDGSYFLGVEPGYGRDNDIVTDNITNLMWQDDGNVQSDNDCSNVGLGGYNDWRVPTLEELYQITELNQVNPAMDANVFKNIPIGDNIYYKSSTFDEVFLEQNHGLTVNQSDADAVVRCVRGSSSSSILERDTKTGVVWDYSTNLTWDDFNYPIRKGYSKSIEYCENLILGRYDDWRVPNIRELETLIDRSHRGGTSVMSPVLKNMSRVRIWSSSTFIDSAGQDAFIGGYFTRDTMQKSDVNHTYVRCVRGEPFT